METKLLIEKYRDQLKGVLHCYDRIIITGSLQPLCYAQGMTGYLYKEHIRIFDYAQFAEPLSEQIRKNTERIAKENHITIEYPDKKKMKQEEIIAEIIKKRGEHPGLVHIIGAMEKCMKYKPWHDKAKRRTFLKPGKGRCMHYYFYFVHPMLGLCFFKVATWCPYSVEFYCNGHNWLASKLRERGIEYHMCDNAFSDIADFETANSLAAELDPKFLHRELDNLARLYCPVPQSLGLQYRWSVRQAEYSTDLVFMPGFLPTFYQALAQTLFSCIKPEDIAAFLGRKLNGNYQGEITTRYKRRDYCICLKHIMGLVGIKIYDKFGLILRIETTVNDVSFFQHYREVIHRSGRTELKQAKMKKSIYSLAPLQKLVQAANRRYLEFISVIETPHVGVPLLNKLTKSKQDNQHSYKGFNLLSEEDAGIFRALLRGEFNISGLTHKSLRQYLPDKNPGQLSRLLKRLHVFGLLKKVAHRYKYYLTDLGREAAASALKLRELVVIPALACVRNG
jgi:hypothetical protein